MAAFHRNNVGLSAKRCASAAHGSSEPGSSQATDDTNYGDLLDSSPATRSKITSVLFVSISDTPLDGETRMVNTPSSIARW